MERNEIISQISKIVAENKYQPRGGNPIFCTKCPGKREHFHNVSPTQVPIAYGAEFSIGNFKIER